MKIEMDTETGKICIHYEPLKISEVIFLDDGQTPYVGLFEAREKLFNSLMEDDTCRSMDRTVTIHKAMSFLKRGK